METNLFIVWGWKVWTRVEGVEGRGVDIDAVK